MPRIKAQDVSVKNITAALLAIGASASLVMGSIRFIRSTADSRYAQRDSLLAYQQGQSRAKSIDSLNYTRDMRDVKTDLSQIKADIRCLKPRNQLLPECQ